MCTVRRPLSGQSKQFPKNASWKITTFFMRSWRRFISSLNDLEFATLEFQRARELTGSNSERAFLEKRLEECKAGLASFNLVL
jgi:hypothetical protein